MRGFEWAERNLDVASPHELQSRGVNVFFAPNIERGSKVVDLADGRVDVVQPEEERVHEGYFADFASLEQYCYRTGLPLAEVEGYVSLQPVGKREAGDPLRHEGP